MTALYIRLTTRFRDDEGATAVEYGLLVALVAVVMAVGAAALGTEIDELFDAVVTTLTPAD